MMIEQKNDQELVALYREGNDRAFELLLLRHKSRVYLAIYMIVKDRYVAEDLFQDVFIKVVDRIKGGRYNEEGKFLPWIYRMAHNLAIDYFRKQKRGPEIVTEGGNRVLEMMQFADTFSHTGELSEEGEGGRMLKTFIKELPVAQRHVLIMRHYFQMDFKEIADRTGVSINTALGRMRYALINLRKKMPKKHFAYDSNFYSK